MSGRWRVVLLRAKGEILGTVEAPDAQAAKVAAAVQFELDDVRRNRIIVQELAAVKVPRPLAPGANVHKPPPTGGIEADGVYIVTSRVPGDGPPQYRIKHPSEEFERVAMEGELSASEPEHGQR